MFRQSTNQNHYLVFEYWVTSLDGITAGRFRRCWEEKTTRSNRMNFRLPISGRKKKWERVRGLFYDFKILLVVVVLAQAIHITHQLLAWFSHDVTKIRTKKLSILPRFYFHDALEQLKTNSHTNLRFKRVLGFVIEYAWISKLLRDAAFTWRPRVG